MALIRSFVVDGVQCVDSSGGNARYPKPDRLQVTMDSTWAPYVQATLSGPPPSTDDLLAIDPRKGWRVRFTVTSFDETQRQLQTAKFDLDIRTRARGHAVTGPDFRLDAASGEAALQDFAQDVPYNTGSNGTYQASQLVSDAITLVVGGTITRESGYPDAAVAAEDTQWAPAIPAWDYVSQLAEAAGARLWGDEARVFHWASPTWTPDTAVKYLKDGIIRVDDQVSRDDPAWANYAVVAYDGNSPVQYVSSSGGTNPRKAIVARRPRRKPAGNAAAKIRTTAQARGRNLTVTAVADLTFRPNHLVQITYEGFVWQGRVQSVAWNFPEGTMRLVLNVIES